MNNSRRNQEVWAGPQLQEDACPRCGALMRHRRGRLSFPVNGETVSVLALHLKCPRCRETVLRLDQAQTLREMAQAAYRRKHHLLSSSEIHAIRRRFRLTQAALARLLRLGPNTFSRWEAGRNVQSAAMDVVLRMLRDLPGSLKYLQKRAA